MGATQQALLAVGAGASAALDKAAVAQAFPGSTFSTSSTSYVDLLNGSGGAVISVSLTKGTGTRVLIAVGMTYTNNANAVTLGVNDGTSDTDVCQRGGLSTAYPAVTGEILLSGLAAGTYTFTLRVKVSAGTTNFDSNCSAFIRAWEVT